MRSDSITPIHNIADTAITQKVMASMASFDFLKPEDFKHLASGSTFTGKATVLANGDISVATQFGKLLLSIPQLKVANGDKLNITVERFTDSSISLKIVSQQNKADLQTTFTKNTDLPIRVELTLNTDSKKSTTGASIENKIQVLDSVNTGQSSILKLSSVLINKEVFKSIFNKIETQEKIFANQEALEKTEPSSKYIAQFVRIQDSKIAEKMANKEFYVSETHDVYLKSNYIGHGQYNISCLKNALGYFDGNTQNSLTSSGEKFILQLLRLDEVKQPPASNPIQVKYGEILQQLIEETENNIKNMDVTKYDLQKLLPAIPLDANDIFKMTFIAEFIALFGKIKNSEKRDSLKSAESTDTKKIHMMNLLETLHTQTEKSGWQLFMLPFLHGTNLEICKFYIENDDESDPQEDNSSKAKNFIIELDLKKLGPIAIKCTFSAEKNIRKLDCEIQTEYGFPYQIKDGILDVFTRYSEVFMLKSTLRFTPFSHNVALSLPVQDDMQDDKKYITPEHIIINS